MPGRISTLQRNLIDPVSIRVYETINQHREVSDKLFYDSIFVYKMLRDNADRVGPMVFSTIMKEVRFSKFSGASGSASYPHEMPFNEQFCHYISGGFMRLWIRKYHTMLESIDAYEDNIIPTTKLVLSHISEDNLVLRIAADYGYFTDIDFYDSHPWNPSSYLYQNDLVTNNPSHWMLTDSSIKVNASLVGESVSLIPLSYNFNRWREHFTQTKEEFNDPLNFHIGKIIMEHDFFHNICHFSTSLVEKSFIPYSAVITALTNTLVPNKPINKISRQRVKKLIDKRGMSWYYSDTGFMDRLNPDLNNSSSGKPIDFS